MRDAAFARFEFGMQQAAELLVSRSLLKSVRKALPVDARVRLLPREQQWRGDMEVSLGGVVRTVEIKIESYPASLYPEVFQMWRHGQELRFRRSWAFTTLADTMLYVSPLLDHGLWVPRHRWLKTGLELLESAMLASLHQGQLFTPNLTLNSKASPARGREFTGAAVGAALSTASWLRAVAQTDAFDGMVLTDLGDLMPRVLRFAQTCAATPERTQGLFATALSTERLQQYASALGRWAQKAQADRKDGQKLAAAQQVVDVWRDVRGCAEPHSLEEGLVLWAQRELSNHDMQPVQHPTVFLAHACFEGSWANCGAADSAAELMGQASALVLTPVEGEEAVWPRALGSTCHLRSYGSKERHGRRPSDAQVLAQWALREQASCRELKRAYLAHSRQKACA